MLQGAERMFKSKSNKLEQILSTDVSLRNTKIKVSAIFTQYTATRIRINIKYHHKNKN